MLSALCVWAKEGWRSVIGWGKIGAPANRFHGGKSTGAKNPRIIHGRYTKEAIAFRRLVTALLRETNETVEVIESDLSITSFGDDNEA